jgi:3-oxoacyl-[acyl-carrier-protein] synthase-3
MVNTSDEWITTRTGIKERHIGQRRVHHPAPAPPCAMEAAGVTAEEIDLIVVATITRTCRSLRPPP